jgi:hypothetical protein
LIPYFATTSGIPAFIYSTLPLDDYILYSLDFYSDESLDCFPAANELGACTVLAELSDSIFYLEFFLLEAEAPLVFEM